MAKDTNNNTHSTTTTTVGGKNISRLVPVVVIDGKVTAETTDQGVKQ